MIFDEVLERLVLAVKPRCEVVPHCWTVWQRGKGVFRCLIMLPDSCLSRPAVVVEPVEMWVSLQA